MLRILHLLADNKLSGAEQVTKGICLGLRNEYEFAYCSPVGPIQQVIEASNIKFLPLARFSRSEIAKTVREFKPDVIHAHDYRASFMAASLVTRAKVVSHLHNNWPWAKRLNIKTMLYSLAQFRFSTVLVVSEAVIDEFVFSPLLRKKAKVISNTVDAAEIKRMAEKERVEECDLLFVGRMTEQKDPLSFINIAAALKERLGGIKAIMIGTGELEKDCHRLIQASGLEENVKLLGFVGNPYTYMKQARLLVLPSRWEGFGLVALEGMVLGTPVLCNPVGGLGKLVEHGEGGFHCQNLGNFAKYAAELLGNRLQWEKQKLKSKDRGKLLADPSRFFEQLREAYSLSSQELREQY